MRSLTKRERFLLGICLATLFIMANLIGAQVVVRGLRESGGQLRTLESEQREQRTWLTENQVSPTPAEMEQWLDAHLPELESAGKAQGELLEKLQNEAFERKLKLERQSLLEPRESAFFQEVSVNLIVRGDMAEINEWLATLQDPAQFLVIRNLELTLDTRSKEKETQARCNLTVARWFKP